MWVVGLMALSLSWGAPPLLPYRKSVRPPGADGKVMVVSTAAIPEQADRVLVQTLAGGLARQSPTIYTIASDLERPAEGDTTVTWLRQLQRRTNIAFDTTLAAANGKDVLRTLLTKMAPQISGYVWYDPQKTSVNAALIRCAWASGVTVAVGTNSSAAILRAAGVPMVTALPDGTTPLHELRAAPAGALSNRIAIFQPDDGGKAEFLADFAVFSRAATVEHSPQKKAQFAEALAPIAASGALGACFGWGYDEHEWVSHITAAGAVAHASDFATNLAFMSNIRQSQIHSRSLPSSSSSYLRAASSVGSTRRVHTVAFVTSDGDNIQLLEHEDFIGKAHFGSPLRGQTAVSWSYSPAMSTLMPISLEWTRSHLTTNDSLSAGPSGAGYSYPALFPSDRADLFAKATALLMNQSGQSILNVIGVIPSHESLLPLLQQSQIQGVVYFTFSQAQMGYAALHGNVAWINNVPVVGARLSLWGDATDGAKVGVDGMFRQLQQLSKDPSDPASYSIVVSELGNNYSEILRGAKMLEAAGGFEVVLPAELFRRLATLADKRSTCPLPSGHWGKQVGSLPLCTIEGRGSCILSCDGINLLHIPVSCDLHHCSNISLSADRRHFLCPDGSFCRAE